MIMALLLCPGLVNAGAIHIVSYNMGTRGDDIPNQDDVVRSLAAIEEHADVLLAQEIPWNVKPKPLAEALGYDHYVFGFDFKPQSMRGIFSDTPLRDPFVIPLLNSATSDTQDSGVLCAVTTVREKDLLLCSVHLETIREDMRHDESLSDLGVVFKYLKREFFEDNIRSRSVDQLLTSLKERNFERVIIGGDFNTVPLSKAIRAMNAEFEDAFWPSTAFFKGSYLDSPFPLNPRIDYIFHSPDMSARDGRVHDVTTGDHVPVSAVIMFE